MSRSDVEALYLLLQETGSAGIGNRAACRQLAWRQFGRFVRARDTLIAADVVRVLPGGRGGRLVLVEDAELPDLEVLDVANERGLYPRLVPHVVDLLCEGNPGTEDDLTTENVAVHVTGDLGGARTGGRFSRPDLVGVVRRPMTGFDALEVHGFEVKPYWAPERLGIYEAVAQRALGLCTHAWVLLYLPDADVALGHQDREMARATRGRLDELTREAADLGLGLIVVGHFGDGGVDVATRPTRFGADPVRLDRFLNTACPGLLARIGVEPRTVSLS